MLSLKKSATFDRMREDDKSRCQAMLNDFNSRRDTPSSVVYFNTKDTLEAYISDSELLGPQNNFEVWLKKNGTCRVRLGVALIEAIGGYDVVTALVENYGQHKMVSAGVFECVSKIEIVGRGDDAKVRIDKLSDGATVNLLYTVLTMLQADRETKTA